MTQTHTYVELEISEAAYNEISAKLLMAQYYHVFAQTKDGEVMDMQGIALKKEN